ncbi:Polynucleotidyl transferase, ribonuclease H superfamily protein [Trifolium repens]|nr:Polynucleotidyl transferase, ribonuclease H superfamily protein [Trifolium repens]
MTNKIPKACLDEIQKLQRSFIWGDSEAGRKYHAVNWGIVTTPKRLGGLGLRRLDIMNQACLLKLGWKMYIGANDLWCQVLKGKYNCTTTRGVNVSPASASSFWKTIINLETKLNDYCFWAIGDGTDVAVWNNSWIECGFKVADMDVSIPVTVANARVCDLVDNEGGWNWNMMDGWLPADIMQKITAILPPSIENGKDIQLGIGKNSDEFSVASMYNLLCNFDFSVEDKEWREIWKLRVSERNRCFMWIVKHDRILTKKIKARMGIGNDCCNFCNEVETSLHVLRDCGLAITVWLPLVPQCLRSNFFDGDLKQWFSANVNCGIVIDGNVRWKDVWATACQSLWYWHNKEQHDPHYSRPINPGYYIRQRAKEYQSSFVAVSQDAGQVNREARLIGWKPPVGDWIKLNTDGACKDENVAGCGGILRNNAGEWCGGFAKHLGKCSAFVAELWGVLEGLQYAW